ncbi:hypothetical protein [Microbacterium sp. USTB-Y]|uniref:hypothetical protein n=1 Tax=Microbacterium sp. USTB-Y TaxID=2823692 RepID=UPI00203D15D2|nr:hypothetical protein [Microbacterium sp. USTB-Y]
MSTWDQRPADQSADSSTHGADPSSGGGQLTRKQLRESRLTGSTPIVTEEEAAAARLQDAVSVPPVAAPETSPDPVAEDDAEEPLTRRQIREQERIRTGSVPVHDPAASVAPAPTAPVAPSAAAPMTIPERPAAPAPAAEGMITDVPRPAYPSRRRSYEPAVDAAPAPSGSDEEQEGVDDAEQAVAPVSVSAVMRAEEETGRTWHAAAPTTPAAAPAAPSSDPAAAPAVAPLRPAAPMSDAVEEPGQSALWSELVAESDATPEPAPAAPAAPAGSSVNPAFGARVLSEQSVPTAPGIDSFDTLIGDSTGSHHAAPNALIFQQAPAGPSLSGPVASTGEILVTGSYELPAGLGSRGHADGVADGKEIDAVLLDGELAPSSSPTPIAASAAIGTIKPAGEVIRPPEPEKGNKLMLALTITAGALAVALVGALIVAIATGAFSS